MRTKQYIGEGSTFLVVILIGAFVVYKSFQRKMILSRQQNNFMLSVTHELKSPLAGIKLNLQTLEKYKLDEDKRKVLLDRCIKESNRLNDLCNNMLYASRIEGRQYTPAKENFNFSEMALECYTDYLGRYPGRFNQEIHPGCYITGDQMMLQIAINNLLENAIKYTPPDKTVLVKLSVIHNKAHLEVIDEGTGVPDVEKKKIFTKFYRIGNEDSRKTKGTGLGLYLTNKIVQQHNGLIAVKDNLPHGAIFEILLPLS
jgi:signal transduction histidine kinase